MLNHADTEKREILDKYVASYIYKDDIFRIEEPKEDELKSALNDFRKLSKNSFNEVIFYTIKYKLKYNLEKILGE